MKCQKGNKVDANAVSRRRGLGRSPQRGCFRRKPALQMPLSSTTLPVKMQCRTARRLSGIALIKIILPLNMARDMARAKRKPFKIVRPALPQALRLTARRGSGCTLPWKRNAGENADIFQTGMLRGGRSGCLIFEHKKAS